jgi:hypothetical protein
MAIKVNLIEGEILTLWVDGWLMPSAEERSEARNQVNQRGDLLSRRSCGQFGLPTREIFVRRGGNVHCTRYVSFCHFPEHPFKIGQWARIKKITVSIIILLIMLMDIF